MPNYYHNKLIITGDPTDLMQFKIFIGENISKDFSMYTLNPVPTEIENDSEVSASWRKQNWGCKGDLRDINVLSNTVDELIINYLTPWMPNDKFIWFLNEKFNKLIFQLIYFEGVLEEAEILIMYKDEWWDNISLDFNIVDFVRNYTGKPYAAIQYDDELIKKYNGIYKSIAIIGGKWEEELEGLDLSADTVSNWDKFIEYMNVIKNENEQNPSLISIGGLKHTKIYEDEPQEFILSSIEKVISLPVSDDAIDLTF